MPLPQLFNFQTNQLEELPFETAQAAVSAGTHGFRRGQMVDVVDPSGVPGQIAAEDAQNAFQSGYRFSSPAQLQEAGNAIKYGDSLENTAKAFGLGAARGLSIGTSDYLLTKSGLISQETLRELKERHPIASMSGEIASLVVPMGELSAAVKGVGQAGKFVEAAILGERATDLAKVVEGVKEVSLARQVLARGVGEAAVGTAFGAGALSSEAALGQSELNAETLMSHLGTGALLGGGLGAGLKLAEGTVAAVSNSKAMNAAKQFLGDLMGLNEEALVKTMATKKANIGEIRQAAEELGVDLTKGMESASYITQGLEDKLSTTPTMFGNQVRQQYSKIKGGIQENVSSIFNKASEDTARETGVRVRDEIIGELKGKYDPIGKAYEQIKGEGRNIPIPEKLKDVTKRNIDTVIELETATNSPIAKEIKSIASRLDDFSDVEDLRKYLSTEIRDKVSSLYRTGETNKARILDQVKSKMENLMDRSVIRESVRLGVETGENGRALARSFLEDHANAKLQYSQLLDLVGDIGKGARAGKVRSVGQLIDRLNDMEPTEIAKNLFNVKKVDAMTSLKQNFPAQFDAMRDSYIAQLMDKTSEASQQYGRIVNVNKLYKEVDKLEPEVQALLFSPGELKTINNAKILTDAFPKALNPSGTAVSQDFGNMLSLTMLGRDLVLYALYRGMPKQAITKGLENAEINNLAKTATVLDKEARDIGDRVHDFIRSLGDTTPIGRVATKALLYKDKETPFQKFERVSQQLDEIENNPEQYAEKSGTAVAALNGFAPGHAEALNLKLQQAMAFLGQKRPKSGDVDYFRKVPWVPTSYELQKFSRYVDAVENPKKVLNDMSRGVVSAEGVETLKTVYPQMFQLVQQAIAKNLPKYRQNLSYPQKVKLSQIFGVALDKSMEPNILRALQSNFQEQPEESQSSSSGLGKLDLASETETDVSKLSYG